MKPSWTIYPVVAAVTAILLAMVVRDSLGPGGAWVFFIVPLLAVVAVATVFRRTRRG
ncbi:hypothetical protein DFJ67_6295 [Asanoa ferruginea]|uniref:Uncharacterized protein n=1 Tax=Asanoa ferruginea TaxID=53367 RepID=A0A3D9ZVY3_9ACTN|nr:hypothetical protein [Asanoa ferruginea]REG00244.1 hypothetical protein DFJ67_6295 [Asanoa ferruginea]GIF46057.1 hypothetical protein Afe04nite_05960 [Asanoa ferruginea]